jgi:hypothetical protein
LNESHYQICLFLFMLFDDGGHLGENIGGLLEDFVWKA